ncbi:MAG: ribosome recycling factor [Eubacterium sp.]|nr:ribosome recycling factor [Eubacterium sp.]
MEQVFERTESRMDKCLDSLDRDFQTIRAGRANPKILNNITVEYYGTPTPLNQLASISVPEARLLTIQPFDPSILKDIEKAINVSDIGINPQNDGKIIRLAFPQLTEEHRKSLVKEVSKRGEDAKVAIRNVRRDAMDDIKKLKKNSEITEDEQKDGEKRLQDITDKYIKQVDTMVKKKEEEVLSI